MAITPTDDMILNAVETLNELARQINQRIDAIEEVTDSTHDQIALLAAEDDLRWTHVRAMQDALLWVAGQCVNPEWLEGESEIPDTNTTRFFADVFGSEDPGYWRKVSTNAQHDAIEGYSLDYYAGAGYVHGFFTSGDHLGPWLFYDMQAVLDKATCFRVSRIPEINDADGEFRIAYTSTTAYSSTTSITENYALFARHKADNEAQQDGGSYLISRGYTESAFTVAGLTADIDKTVYMVGIGTRSSGTQYADIAALSLVENESKIIASASGSGTSIDVSNVITPLSAAAVGAFLASGEVVQQWVECRFYIEYVFV